MEENSPQELDYAPPQKRRRSIRPWSLIASMFMPTAVMAAGIAGSHWQAITRWADSDWFGWTVFGAAMVCGVILFLRSGLPRVILIPYVVIHIFWIFYFSICFDCAVFRNCL